MLRKAVWLLLFAAIFLIYLKTPTDPDFGWHLRNGGVILDELRFPLADEYSHTMTGYKVADSWWAGEVIIVSLYRWGAYAPLVVIFTSLATLALVISLSAGSGRRSVVAYTAAALAGAILSTPMVGVRPQVFSFFFLAVVWWWARRYLRQPASKLLLWLPPIFVLWANLHAGFVIGLGLLGVVWFGEAVGFLSQRFWPEGPKISSFLVKPRTLLEWLGGILAAAAATLVNPYGSFLWRSVLIDAQSDLIKNNIQEWLAPNFHSDLGLFLLLFLLLVWLVARRPHLAVSFSEVLVVLAFVLLAFSGVRHFPLLVVVATPLIAEALTKMVAHPLCPFKKVPAGGIVGLFLGLFILAWGGTNLPKVIAETSDWHKLTDAGGYPREAVEWLKVHPPSGKMFNVYGWGGFLIWQLPEAKTFIDGRMCGWQSPDTSIFASYLDITQMKPEMDEVLEKFKVSWALVGRKDPLAQYFRVNPAWKVAYEDAYAVVATKR